MTGLHYDCIGIVDCDMIMDCTGVAVGWRFAVGDGGSVFLGLAPRLDWIVLGYCRGCDLGGKGVVSGVGLWNALDSRCRAISESGRNGRTRTAPEPLSGSIYSGRFRSLIAGRFWDCERIARGLRIVARAVRWNEFVAGFFFRRVEDCEMIRVFAMVAL